ncbi:MAG: AsmA family protein [Rhodospirillales bacterium]|jgi:AsmA protein
MKKLLIGIAAIVVLLISAAIIIPFVIPVETIKAELITQAKQATGRDVRIDGDFKLAVFPNAEFIAGKVLLGNAKGSKVKTMVSLDRLTVRVGLIPLLSGNVQVDAFILEKPQINLEIDKNGKLNWAFSSSSTGASPAPKAAAPSPASKSSSGGAMPLISGIKLGDVRLVNGTVTYADARTSVSHRLDAINWKVALPSLSSPVTVNGDFVWNKEKIEIALKLATPDTLLKAKKTSIETTIGAAPIKLTFNGSAINAKILNAGGQVSLDVPSIRKLAAWVGSPLNAPGSGYGPLKIGGTVDVNGDRYAFKKATLAVDKISGSGDFSFDGRGRVSPIKTRNNCDAKDAEKDNDNLNPPPSLRCCAGFLI